MTTVGMFEDLLRNALERLAQQEQRTDALESVLRQINPSTAPPAPVRQAGGPPAPAAETIADVVIAPCTPPLIPRPPQREPAVAAPYGRHAAGDLKADRGARHSPGAEPHAVSPLGVLSSIDDVVWSSSLDGQQLFFLAGAVDRTFGRPAADFLSCPGRWLEVLPGNDRVALRAAFRDLSMTDQFVLEHRIETPSGSVRRAISRGRLVRDQVGRPTRVDGTTTDIATLTRADRTGLAIVGGIGPATGPAFLAEAVRHLATEFGVRAAVVAVPDPADRAVARTAAAWVDGRTDGLAFSTSGEFVRNALAGRSQFALSAARERFPADDLLAQLQAEAAAAEPLVDSEGRTLGCVVVADDRAFRPGVLDHRSVLKALAPRVVAELTRPADSGDRVRALEAQLAAAEERAAHAEGQLRDVTAGAQQMTERLRQAQRLETVGRLVAGVAHDFNNLLTVIAGHAELLRDLLPPDEPLRDPTDIIVSTAHTAAGVARQLLVFGKPSVPDPCPVDPNAAVQVVERMLRRLVGDRVQLDVLLAPGVAPIRVDPGQFDQVLLNLVANARDAIADAGTVCVRTAEAVVGPDRPGWPATCPTGEYVVLTVTDTGCGMTGEVQARMFEPFYSTKGAHGTGLGMATVRDIVCGAGGHVEVDSTPGWGTSVRIFWPKAEAAAKRTPVPQSAPHLAQGETILLVQDGSSLRDVSAIALQHAGYRVLEAGDGEAGESRARLYVGAIDLVVTDLGLPRRGGRELAARLRALRPGVKVLFVSGYPPLELGGEPFLAKPYTPNDLLRAVRRVLSKQPDG